MFTENDVICGSLLGDGCIKTPTIKRRNICKANCWFSKSECRKYEEYLKWHVDKIPLYNNIYDYTYGSAYIENGKVKVDKTITKIGCCLSSSADIQYTYLRNKWYPSGKK